MSVKIVAITGTVIMLFFGTFPLWKSAVLSPDSIMRRSYWTGGLILASSVLLVPSHWPGRVFGFVAMMIGVIAIAARWTRHLKIRGRTYSYAGRLKGEHPDRPPALAPNRHEWEL